MMSKIVFMTRWIATYLLPYLVQIIFALLWIVDTRLIAKMKQMASSNKTVSTIVSGTTANKYTWVLLSRVSLLDGLRYT